VLTGEHMGLLALRELTIYYQPFEMRQLAASGIWDQTPFLESLESKEFPYILMFRPQTFALHERRWTPEMLEMINVNYKVINNFEGTFVYVPK
jgi:hypothetical protein